MLLHDLAQICKNEIRITPNNDADSEGRLELELEFELAILSRGPATRSIPIRSISSTNCSISWITLRAENDVFLRLWLYYVRLI